MNKGLQEPTSRARLSPVSQSIVGLKLVTVAKVATLVRGTVSLVMLDVVNSMGREKVVNE